MKTVHVLPLFLLLIAEAIGQAPPAPAPAPAAGTNTAPAAAIPNLPITATNLDARRKAILQTLTNRVPRMNTNAIALPAPTAATNMMVAPTTNIFVAPATNVTPAANVAGQVAPPAPGNPPGSATPLPTVANLTGPGQTEGAEHSLKFYNAPVDQIFEKYAEITGRTVLRPASLANIPVTIITASPLTRAEAVQALDGALALNNIAMINQGERFVKAVPSAEAPQHGAAISKLKDGEYPDAEQWATHIVQLKTAKPSEVAQLLASFTKNPAGIVPIDSNQILVIRDYASNIKRMLDLIEQVDVTPQSDYKLEVIPIKYGTVTDLFQTMSSLVSGTSGGAAAGPATPQRRSGQLPTMGGTMGGGGRYGGGGAYNRGMNPYNQQANQPFQSVAGQPGAAAGPSTFQQRLNQIVSRAAGASELQLLTDARIVPDERSNSLIVFANKEDMKMITNIVAKVDVLLAQVLIEGIVMSVDLKNDQTLGVSWIQNLKRFDQNITGAGGVNNGQSFFSGLTNFSSSLPSGFSYFGKLGNNFDVTLQALASDSRARVLQRPRIQTSHAKPADFFYGSTVPYITGIYNYGYGGIGAGGTQSSVEQVQVGVQLSVTPFITPDGLVVMDINQSIDSLDGFVTIDNNQVPKTSSRRASASLSVHDGETIMLGGYIEDNRSTGRSGVPILKDIPGLGALFRSKTRNNDRSELLLLMHVSVLKNPTESSTQVENEKAKLPGISEADKEFKRTEEQSLKKAGLPPLQQH